MMIKSVDGQNVVLTPEEEAAVQAEWDTWAAQAGPRRIPEVKAEAQRRILALDPSWTSENFVVKQMNLMMQVSALLDKKLGGATLTAAEDGLLAAARTIKANIDAIRSASDQVEADLLAAADPVGFNITASLRWPA